MNALSYKGYTARVELDTDDMLLVGRLAGIDDIIGFHAPTMEEFVAAFRESVDDYIEACATIGKQPDKAYSGKVMLRLDPALHADLARIAKRAGKSINQLGEEALSRAVSSYDASRSLARLGGSQPDLKPIPRRRSLPAS